MMGQTVAERLAWSLARKGIVANVEPDPTANGFLVEIDRPKYRGFVSCERLRADGPSLVALAIFRALDAPVEGTAVA